MRYRVLSLRTIAVWAALIVLVGVVVAVWLLLAYTGGNTEANRVQLDAIRTAGTVVVGTGGAAALLLAARRQRSAEIALKQKDRDQAHEVQVAEQSRQHQERVAAATEADAEARRITDLYMKALEQLGSEKVPIRMGGLFALERLAQDNPSQRQTIVNVWCAYLRVPRTPPEPDAPDPDAGAAVIENYRARLQEREVRLTVQRLLRDHLHPGPNPDHPAATFWVDIDIDLTGATLEEFRLLGCQIRRADFTRVRFTCGVSFAETQFTGDARFDGARFADASLFDRAQFAGRARFDKAQFADYATFERTEFTGAAWFERVQFARAAWFAEAKFAAAAWFADAEFAAAAWFEGVLFIGDASFRNARFTGTRPDRAKIASATSFAGAQFTNGAQFAGAQFAGDVPVEVTSVWSPPAEAGREDDATGVGSG